MMLARHDGVKIARRKIRRTSSARLGFRVGFYADMSSLRGNSRKQWNCRA